MSSILGLDKALANATAPELARILAAKAEAEAITDAWRAIPDGPESDAMYERVEAADSDLAKAIGAVTDRLYLAEQAAKAAKIADANRALRASIQEW